jgi:hypothetical protein
MTKLKWFLTNAFYIGKGVTWYQSILKGATWGLIILIIFMIFGHRVNNVAHLIIITILISAAHIINGIKKWRKKNDNRSQGASRHQ